MTVADPRFAFGPERDLDQVRRAGAWLAASLSIGAGGIHLAAGGEHIEALGDIGLGFYWAAIFQLVTGVALVRRGVRTRASGIAIAGNLAILAAWGVSRTLGLPTVPGGPESIGLADGIATILQVLLVALLVVRRQGVDADWFARRRIARLGPRLSVGLATAVAMIVLSTVLAMGTLAAGHGHDGDGAGLHDDAASHGHGAPTAP